MKDRTIPALLNGDRVVSKQVPAGLDGFKMPMGWNFSHMETTKGCEWKCTFKRLTQFQQKLLSFEGKSFQEISDARDSSHSWPDTSRLNKEFQRLIDAKNIDSESIWQLELAGKTRLFGVREHNIFKVMWLDFNHKAYLVEKKNT